MLSVHAELATPFDNISDELKDELKDIDDGLTHGIEHPITNLGFEQFGLDSATIE